MVKRGLGVLLAFVLVFQFVNAVSTEIEIDTLSNHQLRLNFLNPEKPPNPILFETKKLDSGEGGVVTTTFDYDTENFNLGISLINNGTQVLYELIEDINSGEKLYVLLIPGVVEVTKNYQETEVLENELQENEANETSGLDNATESSALTGEATNKSNSSEVQDKGLEKNDSSINLLYYAAGIFIFLLAMFLIYSKYKHKILGKYSKYKHRVLGKVNKKKKFKNYEREIEDAEKKIKEALKEIDEVKRKGKLK